MRYRYDIYLSHASKDNVAARRIALELQHAGFRVWFDEWMLHIGHDCYSEMDQAIADSQSMMLLMSPAFFASAWTRMERYAAAFRDPGNLTRPLLPVLIETCDVPVSLARLKYHDMTEISSPRIQSLIATTGLRLGQPGKERTQFHDKILAQQVPQHAMASSSELAPAYEQLLLAAMKQRTSALIFVDLDGFTYINAKHGVPVGEQILVQLEQILAHASPADAFSSRWRADEFVVFLPNATERTALLVANQIVDDVAKFDWESLARDLYVSISCGISGRNVSGRQRKNKASAGEMDVEWIERAILGCKAAKLRGGAKARIGERLFTSDGERIRKAMNPLAYLAGYGS
ncbi:MAG TPA: TIR domain-containing protein [Noviherbaspirillum sp.]|nr:TIR domain-containing protein [Noviherbaspirillum sp.]